MSEDTIAKLVEFIVERSEKTQKKLNITWYGGEPLLAVGKIKKIMS
jgi:sulfatase maturation enzyme AslB (radical SAM superfamily)